MIDAKSKKKNSNGHYKTAAAFILFLAQKMRINVKARNDHIKY
jgi:hypothetical protein